MITDDDVIDALTKCTGYDIAHTPKPSVVVVQAWAEHFEDFPGVTREDLLRAVKEYHREPRDVMLQPSHLSRIARKYAQERYERSELDSPERLRLERMSDTKAAPDGPALPAGVSRAALTGSAGPPGSSGHPGNLSGRITALSERLSINAPARGAYHETAGHVVHPAIARIAEEARASSPPAPLPCPDCGSTQPCEHDNEED